MGSWRAVVSLEIFFIQPSNPLKSRFQRVKCKNTRKLGTHYPCPRPVSTAPPWTRVSKMTVLEKLVNVRKIMHDTSVKFTEQVPYSFFPLVYGIKCVSVTFHRLAVPTEYQVSRKFMPLLPMTELLCNFWLLIRYYHYLSNYLSFLYLSIYSIASEYWNDYQSQIQPSIRYVVLRYVVFNILWGRCRLIWNVNGVNLCILHVRRIVFW